MPHCMTMVASGLMLTSTNWKGPPPDRMVPRHSPAMSLMDVTGFSGGSEAHPARRRAISAIRAAARAGRQPITGTGSAR